MLSRVAALLMVVLSAGAARADRGALSLDLGAGASLLLLPAPYASDSSQLPVSSPVGRVGLRYALSDALELTFGGFYEPQVDANHAGAVVNTSSPDFTGPDAGRGTFTGTLAHAVQRQGLTAGARYIWGSVFRIHVGADVGWSQRTYSGFDHFEITGSGARSHGLRLDGFSTSNILVAPVTGIEWAFADKWSVSVMPRLDILVDRAPVFGLTVPVLLSHSWYL